MCTVRKTLRIIDSLSEWTGKTTSWACVVLILVLLYEVTARYAFHAPTKWASLTGSMLLCTIVTLGWAYVYKLGEHIRVDVFYARLSARGKAILDVLGALFFLFPFVFLLTYVSFGQLIVSVSFHETLSGYVWYPTGQPNQSSSGSRLIAFSLARFGSIPS